MSSAAMQTAPTHTSATTTSTLYPATTASTYPQSQNAYQPRTVTTSHSPQSVDVTSRNSPSSAKRPNHQPSANGANSNIALGPQHSQYGPVSPAMNASVQQSPQSSLPSDSANRTHSRSNVPEGLGVTPQIPPRTSSNQGSSRHQSQSRSRGEDSNGGRSRRKGQQSPENSNMNHSSAYQSRSDNALGSSSEPAALASESSTVLNQVVITDPAEDIEREHERLMEAQTSAGGASNSVAGLGLVGDEGADDAARSGPRTRQDYSNTSGKRKETTFGRYILGQTLGEGEFAKVKLGWKRDGSVQVAIKLIRRESLGSNPSRLPKIYREIAILRELSHPNIVRLHEMVETDRYIGIIMEYASGGELFDYILKNRYLKDNAARRLFAQLVSGVGYLHKKGIVHRDLKLENLLLDRNRNLIITDFGFANTFNPADELGEEIEYNLTNREFVRRMNLDKTDAAGMRRGDLMQTSCGSPCYAAPELVVSDSLYTGRKVDVWSCGVILYAMLAGYLPFDDDPANPEGDNINLLYKYIVSTHLTFPEYVTPHARDLLRRILVPDPRKRADLFEVARHSWLSEYSHVVSHITSSTTNISDIATTTVPAEGTQEGPALARSASVREPPKSFQGSVSTLGGLTHQQGKVATPEDPSNSKTKTSRETKRRTVQVEYVAPQSQTARGDHTSSVSPQSASATRPGSRGVVDQNKPLPSEPPGEQPQRTAYTQSTQELRPNVGISRSMSETTGHAFENSQTARPNTGHSAISLNAGRLPSRGSYGQPVAPTVAATNAQGRLAQPKNAKQYNISSPIPQDPNMSIGRPSTHQLPSIFNQTPAQEPVRTHKRSSTVSSIGERIFGRSGSFFGGRSTQPTSRPKPSKRYPPTSMKEPYSPDDSRASIDSRRSNSYANRTEPRQRRFSLMNSIRGLSSGRSDQNSESDSHEAEYSRPATGPGILTGRDVSGFSGYSGSHQDEPAAPSDSYEAHIDRQFAQLHESNQMHQEPEPHNNEYGTSDTNEYYGYPQRGQQYNGSYDRSRPSAQLPRTKPGVLQKNNRKFADAYEYERDHSHHSGSSGAARKVMDFFRRRGKARAGEDR
ncbi:serine/threonine protein kinase (Kin4), putative [Talaromyces stipitatus ATCC 10500]|uniref:non-specific serine/threonine protein kinase n=1 Tax=Talaromyces stipitatus (strain ATCC 10500 / CBS 375.48 / QM 6759 / NRRL 1006) TaxID=441959 RepID=B8M2V8_TALSN|nr:serine/threonine protein kinase (Kin4), putative [Talaromyces stipitatus ATCC 10500]EED22213.1 serine/threonine protein kinase (Kin4), putative [Talaromyces stipitatus ATCC 10500]